MKTVQVVRRSMMLIFGAQLLMSVPAIAQGWVSLGLDSVRVSRLRAIWPDSGSMRMAAVTEKGISFYESGSGWTHKLTNLQGSMYFPGYHFTDVAYLPLQPESLLVVRDDDCTENCPKIWKMTYPPLSIWSGRPVQAINCWGGGNSGSLRAASDSAVYIGLCQLFRSTDLGNSWSLVLGDTNMPVGLGLLELDHHDAGGFIAGVPCCPPLIIRGQNAGERLDTVLAEGAHQWLTDALCAGDTLLYALAKHPDSVSGGGIWKSTDAGFSWFCVLEDNFVRALEWGPGTGGRIYASTSTGIQISEDWGDSWELFNGSLPTILISDMQSTPSPDTLFLATYNSGVLKAWKISTEVEERPFQKTPFSLGRNYPNPFNPTTTIEYTLSRAGYVTLKVYNVLGEEVATLVDGLQSAGTFTTIWNASGMASGVFFYRLTCGEGVRCRRMVLTR